MDLNLEDDGPIIKAIRRVFGKQSHETELFILGEFSRMLKEAQPQPKDRLNTLIKEIEDIHREVDLGEAGPSECFEDVEHWPCRTYEAAQRAKG